MYLNWILHLQRTQSFTKMDLGNRAVIPPHSAPERLIHFSAYIIDINDCTLDGKHTLHATLNNLEKMTFSCCYTEKYDTSKACNVCIPGVMNTIFHASDTGVTTELQFDNAIQVEWFDKTFK